MVISTHDYYGIGGIEFTFEEDYNMMPTLVSELTNVSEFLAPQLSKSMTLYMLILLTKITLELDRPTFVT